MSVTSMVYCIYTNKLFFDSLHPITSKPNSVSVPVLSKAIKLILLATLTLSGLIQWIPYFSNLLIASEIPAPKAVGSVGGTIIVIISNALITASSIDTPYASLINKIIIDITKPIADKTNIYFKESL